MHSIRRHTAQDRGYNVSELQTAYATKVNPTEAALDLIARLRQVRGLVVVDSDAMTLWTCGRAEYLNGKKSQIGRNDLPFSFD